ncbi:MAG: flagellar protein FlgN [Myxococcota bacterium]|nr:flagellar protein FlgN [Myxococcota bacterium]
MKIFHDENFKALHSHLDRELDCLSQLLSLLGDEAATLRSLDVTELERISPAKEKLVAQHQLLSRQRIALLTSMSGDGDVPTFSQLLAAHELDLDHPLVEQIFQVRQLAEEVMLANQRNFTFAQSGNGLVSNLIKIITNIRSPQTKTYARNGHLRANLLDSIPRGGQPCSV